MGSGELREGWKVQSCLLSFLLTLLPHTCGPFIKFHNPQLENHSGYWGGKQLGSSSFLRFGTLIVFYFSNHFLLLP